MMQLASYMEGSNMKKLFIFIRLVIFFTIMFALIIVLGKVFTPKWKNGTLSEMDGQDYTINGYYEKHTYSFCHVADLNRYFGTITC